MGVGMDTGMYGHVRTGMYGICEREWVNGMYGHVRSGMYGQETRVAVVLRQKIRQNILNLPPLLYIIIIMTSRICPLENGFWTAGAVRFSYQKFSDWLHRIASFPIAPHIPSVSNPIPSHSLASIPSCLPESHSLLIRSFATHSHPITSQDSFAHIHTCCG